MAEVSLMVEAAVRGYHAYMEQLKAAVDTTLYFERELSEFDDSLDSATDDNLLESETNNKGQPFYVKNVSMIRSYLDGCRTIREPKN